MGCGEVRHYLKREVAMTCLKWIMTMNLQHPNIAYIIVTRILHVSGSNGKNKFLNFLICHIK